MNKLLNLPIAISIKANGVWKDGENVVKIENDKIILKTDRASWVRVEWATNFKSDAIVLGDAWERTYGDIRWKPIQEPFFSPWYVCVKEQNLVKCYGVKTAPNALCSWSLSKSVISLLLDVRCGCLDTLFNGRELVLAELVSFEEENDAFDVLRKFCGIMCEKPVLPNAPYYGGDDWYAYYSNNSFDKIIMHAKKLADCSKGLKNRPFQTIDAGWQKLHNWYLNDEYIGGPYTECNSKFKDMKKMAQAIKDLDVRPGIWIRPLETMEYVPDDAILRRVKQIKYIDPTHPFTIEKCDADIRRFSDWGYELIKHDFATVDIFGHYGPNMTESVVEGDWAFYDRTRTTAEINLEYYKQTAKSAGGMLINACNTFSHLSAGIFPIFRIGDDVSGSDYKRTVEMGVNALAFRGAQHNKFYAVDPDVVPFTKTLPLEKSLEWMELLKSAGTSLIVSIEDECYNEKVKDVITEAFNNVCKGYEVARPLDWVENNKPEKWKTFEGEKTIKWNY